MFNLDCEAGALHLSIENSLLLCKLILMKPRSLYNFFTILKWSMICFADREINICDVMKFTFLLLVWKKGCNRLRIYQCKWKEEYEAHYSTNVDIKLFFTAKQSLFSGVIRGLGCTMATGDVICYLDTDDMLGVNHLKAIANGFEPPWSDEMWWMKFCTRGIFICFSTCIISWYINL